MRAVVVGAQEWPESAGVCRSASSCVEGELLLATTKKGGKLCKTVRSSQQARVLRSAALWVRGLGEVSEQLSGGLSARTRLAPLSQPSPGTAPELRAALHDLV